MKCKYDGKRFNSIKAIGAHYRKHHPGAMKRKRKSPKASSGPRTRVPRSYASPAPTGGIWHPPGCRCDGCK